MTPRIPYFDLRLGPEEKRAVIDVLDSNWLTMGPRIAEFETAFAAALGGGIEAVAVSNCTVALHLACLAAGLGPGDEAICPALTFVATSNAVRYTGATPVFADIESESRWLISPRDIERKITPRTKAILVVHYGGYGCAMAEIQAIAARHNLVVIEDAAHAPVVRTAHGMLGTIGQIGCFSFFSNKNITTGEGGMVVTRDAAIAAEVRSLRSHGMTTGSYERYKGHAFGYDVVRVGFNFRMDEIRAALGLAQLRKLDDVQQNRRRITNLYRTTLGRIAAAVEIPFTDYTDDSGYHVFPVLLPPGTERPRVMQQLADAGIQTSIHYRPVHRFTAYEAFADASVPVTDAIAPRILSLPLYPSLTDGDVNFVVDELAGCLA